MLLAEKQDGPSCAPTPRSGGVDLPREAPCPSLPRRCITRQRAGSSGSRSSGACRSAAVAIAPGPEGRVGLLRAARGAPPPMSWREDPVPSHASRAERIAALLGVSDEVRQARGQGSGAQTAQLILLERVEVTRTVLEATVAELECERERSQQLASHLEARQERWTTRFTISSIVVGAATTITAGLLLRSNTDWLSQAVVGVSGGALTGGLALVPLFAHPRIEIEHQRNALADVWFGPQVPSTFPLVVWAYLTRPGVLRTNRRSRSASTSSRAGRRSSHGRRRARSSTLLFGPGGWYDAANSEPTRRHARSGGSGGAPHEPGPRDAPRWTEPARGRPRVHVGEAWRARKPRRRSEQRRGPTVTRSVETVQARSTPTAPCRNSLATSHALGPRHGFPEGVAKEDQRKDEAGAVARVRRRRRQAAGRSAHVHGDVERTVRDRPLRAVVERNRRRERTDGARADPRRQ